MLAEGGSDGATDAVCAVGAAPMQTPPKLHDSDPSASLVHTFSASLQTTWQVGRQAISPPGVPERTLAGGSPGRFHTCTRRLIVWALFGGWALSATS